jgi:hypothetical protein
MNKFQERHIKLIQEASGETDDIFVTKTGVQLINKTSVTNQAKQLFANLNIDINEDETSQRAEFSSRLTYLSFKDEMSSSADFNDNMVHKFQHLSVYNDEYITFLIAGCSVETELEFIAHNEAKVARLTSSKTRAQDYPLYKLIKTERTENVNAQKELILESIKLKEKFRDQFHSDNEKEIFNVNTFGSKAVSFTITMSLKDWHKTLIGRLSSHGVEYEMLGIMESIANKLKAIYPRVINNVDEYYEMGNGKNIIKKSCHDEHVK